MAIVEPRTERRSGPWAALTLVVAATLVAACGGAAVLSPTASPTSTATVTGSIEWQSCKDDPIVGNHPEIRCASITVPLDYADPSGPTTEIALAILPAALVALSLTVAAPVASFAQSAPAKPAATKKAPAEKKAKKESKFLN